MHRVLLVSMLLVPSTACAPHVVRTKQNIPAAVQLRLTHLPRVWVAGFVTENKPEFDLNTETVRLLRNELRAWSGAQILDFDPLVVDNEERLADIAYWRRFGEEHGWPLIVTGSVKLHLAPPQIVQRGRRTLYIPTAGRVVEATVVLIDRRTGEVITTRKLPSRMRYGLGRFSSGLSLYFQMMNQAMPDWFAAIASGTAQP